MHSELLLLIRKLTDTLFEQTKSRPQEMFEFKLSKEMESFSFSPPINLAGEGNWLLAVTSFEVTNSVFNVYDENNSFSITIPGHWNSENGEEPINKLNEILEFRSQNDIEIHLKEVEKRGTQIELENSG